METNRVSKVKFTDRYQKILTKRLNNPVRKIELCVQLKNKNKTNTSIDIVRLLESHTGRKGNRF